MQASLNAQSRIHDPDPSADRSFQELCHDLRQPAAAILALVAAAESEAELSPQLAQRLRQIAVEARQIATLIGQAAGEGMRFAPIDARAVAHDVIESVRVSTAAAVVLIGEPGLIAVADSAVLRRALGNLVDNALRAAGAEGTVALVVGSEAGWVHFDVHDSGPGFGAGPAGLAGLGLSIVVVLAATHGGDLTILDSHLGGTLARLRIPAALTDASTREDR